MLPLQVRRRMYRMRARADRWRLRASMPYPLCRLMTFARYLPLAVGAVALLTDARGDDFPGQASIIDGDTLEIHGQRIRLWGIDAPESEQLCRGDDSLLYRCGAEAANGLDAFIARRPVNCLPL